MTRPGSKTQHIGPRKSPNVARKPKSASFGGPRSGQDDNNLFTGSQNQRNLQKEFNKAQKEASGAKIDAVLAEFRRSGG